MNEATYPNLNQNSLTKLSDSLLKFYLSKFQTFPSDSDTLAAAKEFRRRMKSNDVSLFLTENFDLGFEKFYDGSPTNQMDAFKKFIGYKNFLKALFQVVSKFEQEPLNIAPLNRKKLPELAAFDIMGNNDLDIISNALPNLAISY